MQRVNVGISIRYKLLFLLTALPLISLTLYLFLATDLFQKDKIAYVYDSSAGMSRSLATQMRIELQNDYFILRTVVEHFDFNQRQFGATAQDLFNKNPRAHALLLFKRTPAGDYAKLGELHKDEEAAQAFINDTPTLVRLRDRALQETVTVSERKGLTGALSMAFLLGEKSDPEHMIMMALYQGDDIVGAFDGSSVYSSFVMSTTGEMSIGGADDVADLDIYNRLLKSKAKEGTAETKLVDGQTYLISYSAVGLGTMVVVSKVDKEKALKAVEVLVLKSVVFFVALLALTLLISVFASNTLTSSLRELYEATHKIAQGDFTVRVKAQSRDEVGGLADSFNTMAGEISRLVAETAEKARMAGELSTVKTVQETLFPPSSTQFGPLRIRGHFEPASECGGDWWNYSRIGDKIFLWIGDATGHGAPAALITSAARSAAAVIETLPEMTPGRALSILNRAIHQTSKGQIMMTFFLACIDLEQSSFTYACASHDPPYFMRKNVSGKVGRKDLMPLNEVNGPRLGDQKDFEYSEASFEFGPGDMVFLYTDGLLDIVSKDGKKWGERTFLKSLVDSANLDTDVDHKIDNLCTTVNSFREGSDLVDDVTMILVEYDQAQAQAVVA